MDYVEGSAWISTGFIMKGTAMTLFFTEAIYVLI